MRRGRGGSLTSVSSVRFLDAQVPFMNTFKLTCFIIKSEVGKVGDMIEWRQEIVGIAAGNNIWVFGSPGTFY